MYKLVKFGFDCASKARALRIQDSFEIFLGASYEQRIQMKSIRIFMGSFHPRENQEPKK